jgi:hypothetical protein
VDDDRLPRRHVGRQRRPVLRVLELHGRDRWMMMMMMIILPPDRSVGRSAIRIGVRDHGRLEQRPIVARVREVLRLQLLLLLPASVRVRVRVRVRVVMLVYLQWRRPFSMQVSLLHEGRSSERPIASSASSSSTACFFFFFFF